MDTGLIREARPLPALQGADPRGRAQVPRLQGLARRPRRPPRALRAPRIIVTHRRLHGDGRPRLQPRVPGRRGAAPHQARRRQRRAGGRPAPPTPGAIGPELEAEPEPPPPDPNRPWHAREIRIGEVHPLDIAWSPSGQSIYVSADDATLREYRIKNGELVHQASVPAQGDHIRLLFGR